MLSMISRTAFSSRAEAPMPGMHLPSEDPQEPDSPGKPPPPQPGDEPPPVPEGDPPSDAPPERAG